MVSGSTGAVPPICSRISQNAAPGVREWSKKSRLGVLADPVTPVVWFAATVHDGIDSDPVVR